jgi:hypothetical protein
VTVVRRFDAHREPTALDYLEVPVRKTTGSTSSPHPVVAGMGYTWQYYDLVLAAIFLSLAAGVLVGQLTTVPPTTSVTAAGFLGTVLVGHSLFVNGPVDDPEDLTDEVDALN